jgi:hypothetical protein
MVTGVSARLAESRSEVPRLAARPRKDPARLEGAGAEPADTGHARMVLRLRSTRRQSQKTWRRRPTRSLIRAVEKNLVGNDWLLGLRDVPGLQVGVGMRSSPCHRGSECDPSGATTSPITFIIGALPELAALTDR